MQEKEVSKKEEKVVVKDEKAAAGPKVETVSADETKKAFAEVDKKFGHLAEGH